MADRTDAAKTEATLKRQAEALRRLSETAQRVQREVDEHLARLDGMHGQKPSVERRRKPRKP
jgi:hypothetical protein